MVTVYLTFLALSFLFWKIQGISICFLELLKVLGLKAREFFVSHITLMGQRDFNEAAEMWENLEG